VPRVCREHERAFAERLRPFLLRLSSFLEPPSLFLETLSEVSWRLSSRPGRRGHLLGRLSSLSERR
jgi:hypothetical protein